MSVENTVITTFNNGMGSAKLSKLANVFVVSFEPRFGEQIVNSFSNRKKAEVDYSHFVHYLISGA